MNKKQELQNIEGDIQKIYKLLSNENDKNILEKKALDILFEIEERVGMIIGDRKPRTALEKEKVFQRYLKLNKIDTEYISIDDILDKLIGSLFQELKYRNIKLIHKIFGTKKSCINRNGIKKEKLVIKTIQKEKIFIRVLYKMGYDAGEIRQYEEKINSNRMRHIPYKIFHLQNQDNQKTVLICDEVGQATFIYDGIILPFAFKEVEKGEMIGKMKPLKVIYRKQTFEKKLGIALNNKLNLQLKEKPIVNEIEEKLDKEKKQASKEELQNMWSKGELQKEILSKKWNIYAKNWNEKNGEKKGYLLPASVLVLIRILGGNSKVSLAKEYIACLLEGREYEKKRKIYKEELHEMFEKGELQEDIFFFSKWNVYAKNWNENNGEEKGYLIPVSIGGLIRILGGDKKISYTKKYIICLLEGREYKEKIEVNKVELQKMWSNGEFKEDVLSKRRHIYAKNWNKKNGEEKGYLLPVSKNGLIGKLGGNKKVSYTKEYIICLLEGIKYKK
ncbi:MAG: hypothetical protein QM490_05585 [Candidatus Gracilibacteria bacterium]